jgi:hypothetical protein
MVLRKRVRPLCLSTSLATIRTDNFDLSILDEEELEKNWLGSMRLGKRRIGLQALEVLLWVMYDPMISSANEPGAQKKSEER